MTQDKRARGAALNFKLRPDDSVRLAAVIEVLDSRSPGISHTRADVVRTALAELARALGCEVAT